MNKLKFYSQINQDQIIFERFFKNKTKGIFVEVGAADGIENSNTLFFEESLNWSGICIEPRKIDFEKLVKNRKCICVNAALTNIEGEEDFLELKGWGKGLSGILSKYDSRHLNRIEQEKNHKDHKGSQIVKVKTIVLDTLLKEYNFNKIDYLSIDTQGNEFEILKTIDFEKICIDVISVENNYGTKDIYNYLTSKGFSFVKTIQSQDEVYVFNRFN